MKVAWICFLYIWEFTYTKANLKNCKIFSVTKLTKADITFLQDNQYVILHLKKSKTDIKYIRVEVIIAAGNNATYSVSALGQIFMFDL